jgi:tetratricopeptide (TPR) repeat protein
MTNLINFLRKNSLYLLAIAAILIVISDSKINLQNKPTISEIKKENTTQMHSEHEEGSGGEHSDEHIDHSDPVNQKRMGAFHYNEGNKFLHKKNIPEAVKNYKMALHHDPENINFYINLSTAYMHGEMFEKAHETLMTLESKSPKTPLLHYNLACYYSLTNKTNSSRKALEYSTQLGFINFGEVLSDPDLKNLRETAGFQEWFDKLKLFKAGESTDI